MQTLTFKQSRPALIALCCLASTACAAPPSSPDLIRLQESLDKWTAAQSTMASNYSYTVRHSSWVGFGHVTKIEVQAGKVVRRSYDEFNSKPRPTLEPRAKPSPLWVETDAQLNSHQQGAPALTVEALYAQCKLVLQQDRAPYQTLYVGYDTRGFLARCFTVDKRIMDDAPHTGVPSFTID